MTSVIKGDSVTLHTQQKMMGNDVIQWWFGNKTNLIAVINVTNNGATVNHNYDEKFRDRLTVYTQSGCLNIKNIETEHAGNYGVQSNRMSKNFTVIVRARLPVPVISSNSSNSSSSLSSSSSSSYCSLLCSVVNVSDVTLSWYKGNSLLFSINASDLSISLSLPLEIECLDDSYSCVVAYSFTNQTTHLNTELCHTCSDSVHCCGSTEAVIRLVLSALVGVATVILLVYDIRSRRIKQDRAHIHTSET
ncbi:uncharacterized protein LOC127160478 [Labeo rohita]|uniref:uncharacterized protein LOC127160478 n=1 Tax=Labeo rohita TaxID=84645 RepID=UPI0021E2E486|nr:uncharacterized protein LOC127160478 [Labeo rohita]